MAALSPETVITSHELGFGTKGLGPATSIWISHKLFDCEMSKKFLQAFLQLGDLLD